MVLDRIDEIEYSGVLEDEFKDYFYHEGPGDRGLADNYYGRLASPHKFPLGTYNGDRVTELTEIESAVYMKAYELNSDYKV